ncbi:IS91 family transposase [Marinicellulosiphila megalodicopiae]|uniref:IS91 family transposase n=1 Tax=Marinicellulosiphila megalodicopiae TaxID=2724896 RepID=UPI003BAFEFEC
MKLVELFEKYQTDIYKQPINQEQKWAVHQMLQCKTQRAGQLDYECNQCHQHSYIDHSCGHRFCPQCGFQANQKWLTRQQQKLLPVDYFMVTFTLPFELRMLAKQKSKEIYTILMRQAVATVQTFAKNDQHLSGQLGVTAVLHTHSRNLNYHPHVHLMIPAGSLSKPKNWQAKRKKYLFNTKNLSSVFRAKFIESLKTQDIHCPTTYPKNWIAHCKKIGNGSPALKYLSQYLYRGVSSEKNLLSLKQDQLTWRYKDSKSKQYVVKTEPIMNFLLRLLQHVLPKGFQRVRNYGLLHGSNRTLLMKIQLMLRVTLPELCESFHYEVICPCCKKVMTFCGFIKSKMKIEKMRTIGA